MVLGKLVLSNFRNFEKEELELDPGVNLFIGDNGQGKTNVIEAVHLLSTTRSFRTSRDSDLIRFGEGTAYVGGGEVEVAIQPGEKVIKLGGKPARAAEVLGEIRSVIFSPQDMSLLSGPPGVRRSYLDELIARVDRKYLLTLLSYNRVLKQRNKQLWMVREGRSASSSLSSWDELLIRDGVAITVRRVEVIRQLQDYLDNLTEQLVGSKVRIRYISKVANEKATKEEISQAFVDRVGSTENEEIRVVSSLTGPHRDDFELVVADTELGSKGRNIGRFGSRGEQRAVILALKLSEVEFNLLETGSRPMLLLDDVLSELDEAHQERILSEVGKQQTLVTATTVDDFPDEILGKSKIFRVKEGSVG